MKTYHFDGIPRIFGVLVIALIAVGSLSTALDLAIFIAGKNFLALGLFVSFEVAIIWMLAKGLKYINDQFKSNDQKGEVGPFEGDK